jgi:putative GTP pyrophosphokinase
MVLANWRASHAYPINTFQALLRLKLKSIDKQALVAQRLKRSPSILAKLERFPEMQLARMQDIGGLRAVVSSMPRVRKLEDAYRNSTFKHRLVGFKDYINEPKPDGYRSVHLVYKYPERYTHLTQQFRAPMVTPHESLWPVVRRIAS